MNNTIKSLVVCAFLGTAMTSCIDMDVTPPTQMGTGNLWKTEKDAWYGLNACYAELPAMDIWNEMCTDNAHSHKPWEGPYELIQQNSITNADDRGYSFGTVRICNVFLANVETCDMDPDLKVRFKAEARFIRAFSYLNLTETFGKVPIIENVPDYNAPYVKRDPIEKVHEFILTELSQIKDLLPPSYDGGYRNEKGRITRWAALALKARAALYFGNYKAAEEAAGEVIKESGHSLWRIGALNALQEKEAKEMENYLDLTNSGIDKDKFIQGIFNYETLWHTENANPNNPEFVLLRGYMSGEQADWSRYMYIRPSQLARGYSSYEPMQDLIDAYWNADGKTLPQPLSMELRKERFTELDTTVASWMNKQKKSIRELMTTKAIDVYSYSYMNEFRNRDSRLYASMLFPFKGWFETDAGNDFYYYWDPKKPDVDGNESWSGYSYRKLVPLSTTTPYDAEGDYPIIRYAEVLLTFAEAKTMNSGWDGEVEKALNELRDRCGMPNVPSLSGQAAIDFIRNERRIELAGEGHRYNDIRRYGDEYANKYMKTTTYAPSGYLLIEKTWDSRLKYMPVPQSAMDLNPLLRGDQNPGY